ncbi:retrovirus-related pol polyprotein [Plakobranchus ocellatus]|uniref:Retrovirus-related pol polyprotein n=1 Tax=Plakobranchus ocellatus TaxID=259542 RepID=A0AAV3Y1U4_9GAST|nr:retrovirus-related pol polyprotein [Plakobranchus ocellatus]
MSIETVALKLSTFWITCPSAWFAQTEAQFALRGITADETKNYHVVAALDIGVVLEQYAHGRWEPLAFFSRQLRKPEIK